MGRLANERHVKFNYFPAFVEHWKNQTPEFKALCDAIGQPQGYTGINVFYVFFNQYWTHEKSGITRRAYQKS